VDLYRNLNAFKAGILVPMSPRMFHRLRYNLHQRRSNLRDPHLLQLLHNHGKFTLGLLAVSFFLHLS
jgi:hypothetical protein